MKKISERAGALERASRFERFWVPRRPPDAFQGRSSRLPNDSYESFLRGSWGPSGLSWLLLSPPRLLLALPGSFSCSRLLSPGSWLPRPSGDRVGACQDPSLHSQKLPRRGRLRLEKPYLPQRKMAGNFFHSRQRADLSDFRSLGGRQTCFRVEIPDFPVSQMNHFCVGPGALLGFPGCSCPL